METPVQVKEYNDAHAEAQAKAKDMLAMDVKRREAVNADGSLDATKWTDADGETYDRLGAEATAAIAHAEGLKSGAVIAEWANRPAAASNPLLQFSTPRHVKTLREQVFGAEPEKFHGEDRDGIDTESYLQKGKHYDTGMRLNRKDASYGAAIGTGNAVDQLVVPDYTGEMVPYPVMPTVAEELFGAGRTDVYAWKYFIQDKPTFGAAEVANTLTGQTTKPMTETPYELISEQTHVVAHYEPIHKTALANIPQLESIIRDQLMVGGRLRVDRQLIWGNGVDPNIQGLYNRGATTGGIPGITTFTSRGVTYTQFYDDIKAMATKSWMQTYMPATVVGMTPMEADVLLTAKTSGSGQYVYGVIPFAGPTGDVILQVWGLKIVQSPVFMNPSTASGSVFVGNPLYGKVVTQDDANISVGWINQQFIQNAETLLWECTVGLEVNRPYGYVVMDMPVSDALS